MARRDPTVDPITSVLLLAALAAVIVWLVRACG
jgi:hypothetical protein